MTNIEALIELANLVDDLIVELAAKNDSTKLDMLMKRSEALRDTVEEWNP